MADVNLKFTMTFEDAKGERFAIPLYRKMVDTTTLAATEAALTAAAALVEAISDAQLIKQVVTLVSAGLPGGIKLSPVSGSDNEETGLFTWELLSPAGKAFATDIPAIAQATLLTDQRTINQADTDVAAFIAEITSGYNNSLWSTTLDSVRAARKTFRKHRRAAARG